MEHVWQNTDSQCNKDLWCLRIQTVKGKSLLQRRMLPPLTSDECNNSATPQSACTTLGRTGTAYLRTIQAQNRTFLNALFEKPVMQGLGRRIQQPVPRKRHNLLFCMISVTFSQGHTFAQKLHCVGCTCQHTKLSIKHLSGKILLWTEDWGFIDQPFDAQQNLLFWIDT